MGTSSTIPSNFSGTKEVSMKIKRFLIVILVPYLTGCQVVEWIADGVEFYQRGRQAAELSNEEIAATEFKKALTAIPLTQWATTATITPTMTLVPGVTPTATVVPTPPPTPIPIMWVRPKSGFVRFYNKPGLVTSSTG